MYVFMLLSLRKSAESVECFHPLAFYEARYLGIHLCNGNVQIGTCQISGTVGAGRQYYLSDTIFKPDSVLAYAPEGVLDTITAAYTQPVKQENVSDTLRQQVSLLARRGVKFCSCLYRDDTSCGHLYGKDGGSTVARRKLSG